MRPITHPTWAPKPRRTMRQTIADAQRAERELSPLEEIEAEERRDYVDDHEPEGGWEG